MSRIRYGLHQRNPDVNVTGQMELDELSNFDSWFNIDDKLTIVDSKDFWKE